MAEVCLLLVRFAAVIDCVHVAYFCCDFLMVNLSVNVISGSRQFERITLKILLELKADMRTMNLRIRTLSDRLDNLPAQSSGLLQSECPYVDVKLPLATNTDLTDFEERIAGDAAMFNYFVR